MFRIDLLSHWFNMTLCANCLLLDTQQKAPNGLAGVPCGSFVVMAIVLSLLWSLPRKILHDRVIADVVREREQLLRKGGRQCVLDERECSCDVAYLQVAVEEREPLVRHLPHCTPGQVEFA